MRIEEGRAYDGKRSIYVGKEYEGLEYKITSADCHVLDHDRAKSAIKRMAAEGYRKVGQKRIPVYPGFYTLHVWVKSSRMTDSELNSLLQDIEKYCSTGQGVTNHGLYLSELARAIYEASRGTLDQETIESPWFTEGVREEFPGYEGLL